ncbi:hypothetical protein ACP70R_004534 [Stipagrostis hirtigluma subsp. patula]
MASPAPPIADRQALSAPPSPLPALADEILEDIFIRLPPADLARTSAACPSFRRIITGRSFLRRFRATHPPPLLGFAAYEGFHPAQPPDPSAPLARALADSADFSYSFVPTGRWNTPWRPRDVRQGRVLLQCTAESNPLYDYYDDVFVRDLELAVCDPLFRRYVLLPPIPGELRAKHKRLLEFGLFLAPSGEHEEDTAFSVVCMACNKNSLVSFVFSSITGKWRIPAYFSWGSLGTVMPYTRYSSSSLDYERCFYWTAPCGNMFLVVDALRLELSVINKDLTAYHARYSGVPLILAGRDGPEVFILADFFGDGPTELMRIIKQNDGESSDEWLFANTISLPSQYNFFTLGAAEGFLFLRGILQDQDSSSSSDESSDNMGHMAVDSPDVVYYSLDVKTRELKKVCVLKQCFHSVYPYLGFPLPLANPSI